MAETNIYLDLTARFNMGRVRAIISSGQAVVLHHLAIMSKDGDWILREEGEACRFVLGVLDAFGAKYRFGAPLDPRWLAGGWSSHFEFMHNGLRVRTDFVSRPPRIAPDRIARLWKESEAMPVPVVDLAMLARLKQTNREKDYPVIGEIARMMDSIEDRFRFSRSARDLVELRARHPEIAVKISSERPLVAIADESLLEKALDDERRSLIHANEKRLARYLSASESWAREWKKIEREVASLPLRQANDIVTEAAQKVLPFEFPQTADEVR
jgi:hypothetical protein